MVHARQYEAEEEGLGIVAMVHARQGEAKEEGLEIGAILALTTARFDTFRRLRRSTGTTVSSWEKTFLIVSRLGSSRPG